LLLIAKDYFGHDCYGVGDTSTHRHKYAKLLYHNYQFYQINLSRVSKITGNGLNNRSVLNLVSPTAIIATPVETFSAETVFSKEMFISAAELDCEIA
jgi:putative heme iron utilization protein